MTLTISHVSQLDRCTVEMVMFKAFENGDTLRFEMSPVNSIDPTVEANLRADLELANQRIKELERGNKWKKGR